MAKVYNKDQCLAWIKNPTINPLTGKSIGEGKKTFKDILLSCKKNLTPSEVNLNNKSMMAVIFPGQSISDTSLVPPPQPPLPVIPPVLPVVVPPKPVIPLPSMPVIPAPVQPVIPAPVQPVMPPPLPVAPAKMAISIKNKSDVLQTPPTKPALTVPPKIQPKKQIKSESKVEDEKIDDSLVIVAPPTLNSFDVTSGSSVSYKIDKLTDKNKILLAAKVEKNLVTESELISLINKDDFIIKLLEAERKYLLYKEIQYTKIINQTKSALSDDELKAKPIKPPGGEGEDDKKKALLDAKIKALVDNQQLLKDRLNELGKSSSFSVDLIQGKRKRINNILNDPINGTNTLIGESREEVKRTIYTQIVNFSKAPGLFINRFNNYVIMGGAGTGKTKLASVYGNYFYNLGLLATSKVLIVTRGDLVAGYIGQTAPLTRKYLDSTLEGVLFIDEAYQLTGCPGASGSFSTSDFGQESIAELINYIDKNIGMSIIMAAGYEEQMNNCFLAINEGMRRRFPNNIRLLDYTSQDLSNILYYNIKNSFSNQVLSPSQMKYISELINYLNTLTSTPNDQKLFNNQAGDMLNLSNGISQDLILGQKLGYLIPNINDTFTKFFINKGLQVTIKA